MSKVNVKAFPYNRILVIFDMDRLARTDYVSMDANNQYRYKPILSTVVDNKVVNTSILYGIFNRMADFNWDKTNFMFAFDTRPNYMSWFDKLYAKGYVQTDNDYFSQLNGLRPILKDSNFTVLEQDGYEAYSLIAKAVKDNYSYYDYIFIYSKDKFLYHLVDEKVSLLLHGNRDTDLTLETYESYLNVPYNLYTLYLCTVGDKKEDISGIKGFGPKSFEKMLIKDEILMKPVDTPTRELITTSSVLKKEQKEYALDVLEWVLPRDHVNIYTRPKQGNKTVFKNYLNMFDMKGVLNKLSF